MVSWQLSSEQREALNRLRSTTSDARVLRNVEVILLSGQGRSKEWIAMEFGCSLGTINNIRRGYRTRGPAGLTPAPRPGRRSRATPQYRDTLRQVVQTSPQSFGYSFRRWSARRLAVHLEQQTGIRFGEDQVRRFLRQEGLLARRRQRSGDIGRFDLTFPSAECALA
ncbi:MAG TPA: helix-turn-helix domain-containing protein [Isosphaeraceae bacterium]|jgi:transposase|nr:helix-turn-helix domain-containing protein [Isosphaeraceae bacterium]